MHNFKTYCLFLEWKIQLNFKLFLIIANYIKITLIELTNNEIFMFLVLDTILGHL